MARQTCRGFFPTRTTRSTSPSSWDMLLTGFDSKVPGTRSYVDKNLKHHGLIQAFPAPTACSTAPSPTATSSTSASRTPWMPPSPSLAAKDRESRRGKSGSWIRPRGHPEAGDRRAEARQLHEVPGPPAPSAVANLKGDEARAAFIEPSRKSSGFEDPARPIHRPTGKQSAIEQVLPRGKPAVSRPVSETAKSSRSSSRARGGGTRRHRGRVDQPDFEFVLRLRRHRLRLHHGPHRLSSPIRERQIEDEPEQLIGPYRGIPSLMDRARRYCRNTWHAQRGEAFRQRHP